MKANYLLLPALLVAAISCKKEAQPEQQIRSQITGQWELVYHACGECIVPPTSFQEGNGNTIEFTTDGSFTRKLKDSIIFHGHYEIVTSKVCSKSGDVALETDEPANASANFITIEATKLQLSTPTCYEDGAVSIYRRVE